MYNRFPVSQVHQADLFDLTSLSGRIVVECYPGVDEQEVVKQLGLKQVVWARDFYRDDLKTLLMPYITEDRIFGKMCFLTIDQLVDKDKLAQVPSDVPVVGFGASLASHDHLIYVDKDRWSITLAYRAGLENHFFDVSGNDALRRIKQGYFVEWRIVDRLKRQLFDQIDAFYFPDQQVALSGQDVLTGLREVASQPFRCVPYFDPGVWGGQWMKEVCGLPEADNYAWSFDGVPEENALALDFGSVTVQLPCMDLVLAWPKPLLGPNVYSRYGAEFPIRFDFLDTMGGGNLSLQVHPTTDFIYTHFGMMYTQNESYYVLDCKPGANVYLGVKEGTTKEAFRENPSACANRFPSQKHDHYLIPAGTVHCSGADSMILEISSTPYNFTFKLYDWGRVGLDGLPRPVHMDYGLEVIDFSRNEAFCRDELINQFEILEENEAYTCEKTGLHPLEPIETKRYWIKDRVRLELTDFKMANLVEGDELIVLYEGGQMVIHYAETFILPADVKWVELINPGQETIGVMVASCR